MAKYTGYTHKPLYVWTTDDWTTWTRRDRLVAQNAVLLPRGLGHASFQLLAKNRSIKTGVFVDTYAPLIKSGIAVSTASINFVDEEPIWAGIINEISFAPIREIADEIGVVTADNFATLLASQRIQNLRQKDISPTAFPGGIALDYAPPFNIRTDNEGVIGNSVFGQTILTNSIYQFAVRREDLGSVFTRLDVVRHIVEYAWPLDLPQMLVEDETPVSSPLDSEDYVESWDLNSLSFGEALDLLLNPSVGLSWYIKYDSSESNFKLVIISVTDQFTGISTEQATLEVGDSDLTIYQTAKWDQVEVRGSRIVFGGTCPFPLSQGAIREAWSDVAETSFILGASSIDEEENQRERQKSKHKQVYQSFQLKAYTPYWDPFIKGAAGSNWDAMPTAPFTPEVSFNSSTEVLTLETTGKSPNLATIKILEWIPWYQGVTSTNADLTDSELPKELMKPLIYRAEGSKELLPPNEIEWRDLLNPPEGWDTPFVSTEQDAPIINIRYKYPEVLGLSDWTNEYPSNYSPTYPEILEAGFYEDLVVTIGIQSAQSLSYTVTRSGVTTPKQKLLIDRPELQCWVMRKFSVLGVNSDSTPDETTEDIFVRGQQDWVDAKLLAEYIGDWAFRERNTVSMQITTKDYELPNWCYLGGVIAEIQEQKWDGTQFNTVNTLSSINTVITVIEWNFEGEGSTISISTSMPENIAHSITGLGAPAIIKMRRLEREIKELKK